MAKSRRAAMAALAGAATVWGAGGGAARAGAEGPRWRLVSEGSLIVFRYTEGDRAVLGRFERFGGEATFDPGDPTCARLDLRIAMASARVDDPIRTSVMRSRAWFDVDAHPEATFELSRLRETSPFVYQADGMLRLKGRERPLMAPVLLLREGDRLRARGEATISRSDFDIGGPEATLFDVGESVDVTFNLIGAPNSRL